MKKIVSFIFVALCSLVLVFAVGCGGNEETGFTPVAKENIKIGLICLHDKNSTYDLNFIDSMERALKNLGISENQLELATGIPEGEQCYSKATELAKTCNVVFADSFGHEDYLIQAAQENPTVRFCHATGEKAHLEAFAELDNFSNAFANIYQGRYLAGIAAGMKLNELNEGKETKNYKMGYVGAYPYAEVISGYTSFYLGAKSVCPEVTMEVRYTSSWFDFNKEQSAANALIAAGCALISQHADSYGAPQACEDAGIPNVTYNGSTESKCPTTYVVSSKIDWAPYFEYMINCVINGEKIATDWVGTLENEAVVLTSVGKAAAKGTQEAIDAAKAKLIDGSLKVFNCENFTVNGSKITSYKANVDFDEAYTPDTEVIKTVGGVTYFAESEFRAAPYFDIIVDGITIVNTQEN